MNPNEAFKKRRRGRPIGFKLSKASKLAIAKGKTGSTQSVATRNKISASLRKYFEEQESISEELTKLYPAAKYWLKDHAECLNGKGIRTEKHLDTMNAYEIQVGDTVNFYGHALTPLDILLSFETGVAPSPQDYRNGNRERRNSGKDYCNIVHWA